MKNLLKETANQTINLAKGVTGAASEVFGALGKIGGAIGAKVSMHSHKAKDAGKNRKLPGASPGIENIADLDVPPAEGLIGFHCLDYNMESTDSRDFKTIEDLLAYERPASAAVRWINIDGLHPYVVNKLKDRFAIHTLAAEDVLSVPQRPKLEAYEDHMFIVIRMLTLSGKTLSNEQVSVFFSPTRSSPFRNARATCGIRCASASRNPAAGCASLEPNTCFTPCSIPWSTICFPSWRDTAICWRRWSTR